MTVGGRGGGAGGGGKGGDDDDPKKRHNKRQSGRKADKKKAKMNYRQVGLDKDTEDKNGKGGGGGGDEAEENSKLAPDPTRNPKAFAFNNVKKLEKKFRRTADIKEKRKRLPEVDRTPLEPPPFIVALVGPPKVADYICRRLGFYGIYIFSNFAHPYNVISIIFIIIIILMIHYRHPPLSSFIISRDLDSFVTARFWIPVWEDDIT